MKGLFNPERSRDPQFVNCRSRVGLIKAVTLQQQGTHEALKFTWTKTKVGLAGPPASGLQGGRAMMEAVSVCRDPLHDLLTSQSVTTIYREAC